MLKFWAFTCLMWLIHSDLGNNFLTLETLIKRQTIDFLKNLLRNVLNYKFKQRKYPRLTPFQDPVFTASVYTEHVNVIILQILSSCGTYAISTKLRPSVDTNVVVD